MIEYSFDLTKDRDLEALKELVELKQTYFAKHDAAIKYWETPLQPASFLHLFDQMLKQRGIELVFKDIYVKMRNYGIFNTNVGNPLRSTDFTYCICINMTYPNTSHPDFEAIFVGTIAMIAPSTRRFKSIQTGDINLYDIEEKKHYTQIRLSILSIRTEKEFEDFVKDFKNKLEEKYGSMIITLRKHLPIFYLEKDRLSMADLQFYEKKKEKLHKMGSWAYYSPAGWIRYPIKEQLIPKEARENWLTVYLPIEGFNLTSYGNVNVADDLGPNKLVVELTNYPLDQGIFVSPRVACILGYNQHGIIHTYPSKLKDQQGVEYYYSAALECLVDQTRLRVPSIFKRIPV